MSEIMDVTDAARLELTLNTRETIIRSMVQNGKLPECTEDRDFLLKALDGMDRTVLSKAKIKSDDTNAKNQAGEAKTIASLLLQLRNSNKSATSSEPLPVLDEPSNVVHEETFIGVQSFKTEEFQNNG
jgi:hypothetical protein